MPELPSRQRLKALTVFRRIMFTNASLPPIRVYVRTKFLYETPKSDNVEEGHLIGVRSLQNQALQFSVILQTGALYTGLPLHAICFSPAAVERSLEDVLMWDNISSSIQVFTLETLVYMPCTVKTNTKYIISGEYLFSIDYIGHNDLSRSPRDWKQVHVIKATDGNMYIYPQYRLQFLDTALCLDAPEGLPKYKHNDTIWRLGS